MGLFDDLKKIGKEFSEKIEQTMEDNDVNGKLKDFGKAVKTGLGDFKDKIGDKVDSVSANSTVRSTSAVTRKVLKDIPATYNDFPLYDGRPRRMFESITDRYTRFTMDFEFVSIAQCNDYCELIQQNGYIKNTPVRFDKDNTYIIVDYKNSNLNLVFHIKK